MTSWQIQRVYHGANLVGSPFSFFDHSFTGQGYDVVGSGFYFTDCRETAMQYSRKIKEGKLPGKPYLYVADLTFNKPFIRLNRDNCEPIMVPCSWSTARMMLSCAPKLHDMEDSPLINFGHGEALIDRTEAGNQARRLLAMKQISHYYTDGHLNINAVELDWYKGSSQRFRDMLATASGYDSLIVHFPDGENTFVAWAVHQIEIMEIHDDRQRIR